MQLLLSFNCNRNDACSCRMLFVLTLLPAHTADHSLTHLHKHPAAVIELAFFSLFYPSLHISMKMTTRLRIDFWKLVLLFVFTAHSHCLRMTLLPVTMCMNDCKPLDWQPFLPPSSGFLILLPLLSSARTFDHDRVSEEMVFRPALHRRSGTRGETNGRKAKSVHYSMQTH